MQNTEWEWILCTRTKSKDYFWIDNQFRPTCISDLYARVGDETSQRTGYFLIANGQIEIGIGNLDAKRDDRFGRHIRHILLLRARVNDNAKAAALRLMFAEAIGGASDDPLAAELSRQLYADWEKHKDSPTVPRKDWLALMPTTGAFTPPVAEPLPANQQLKRTPQVLSRFASTALDSERDILLLCAASNPLSRIWPIPALTGVPTVICADSVGTESELPSFQIQDATSGSRQAGISPKSVGRAIDGAVKQLLNRKWSFIILVIAMAVSAYAFLSRRPQESTDSLPPSHIVIDAAPSDQNIPQMDTLSQTADAKESTAAGGTP